MEIMEIILLIAGAVIFVLSFLIPDKNIAVGGKGVNPESAEILAKEEIKSLVSQEMDAIKEHVEDVVEEAVSYAMEKTERSLERLSNEKIMAVSEYSDTVLAEIHKNHEEAMFLYDMLNSKHTNLKNTVSEVNRTVKEAEEAVMSIRKIAPETLSEAEEESASETGQNGSVFREMQQGKERAGIRKTKEVKTGIERIASRSPEKGKGGKTEKSEPAIPQVQIAKAPEPQREAFAQDGDEQERSDKDRILELYNQGKSTVVIARELGLGVGEVKLVIDLFKNQ